MENCNRCVCHYIAQDVANLVISECHALQLAYNVGGMKRLEKMYLKERRAAATQCKVLFGMMAGMVSLL